MPDTHGMRLDHAARTPINESHGFAFLDRSDERMKQCLVFQ
jgi:hypothetical protein